VPGYRRAVPRDIDPTRPYGGTGVAEPPGALTGGPAPRAGGPGSTRPLPRATYRLQLHAGFGFDAAAELAGYLATLGVSHVYCSPILRAVPGSTHGYDVVDPTSVNPELGGSSGYDRFSATLGRAGLGQLLDVVANHMAVGRRENRWWWDVLRNGPASRWAPYFDVDWVSADTGQRDTVLLPILADQYGRELEAGRLRLAVEDGEVVVRYYDHAAPLDPSSLPGLLSAAAAALRAAAAGAEGSPMERRERPIGTEEPAGALGSLAAECAGLPPAASGSPELVGERQRRVGPLLARLASLLAEHPEAARALEATLDECSEDIDALDELLGRQNYRLAWWRSAGENLDYRRFFDINDLAGVRVEEPQVFADSHWLILGWLADGVIDGVRIDHVDGLSDPGRYLERLAAAAPGAWIVVEKILQPDESLPPSWPVAGTTGYEWLNRLGDVLTNRAGWERLREGYEAFTGLAEPYDDLVHRAKLAVLDGPLAADLARLGRCLADVCAALRRHRDHTRRDLNEALAEVASSLPVYRTYVAPGPEGTLLASRRDEEVVDQAVRTAGVRRPDLDEDLLGLLREVLLGRAGGAAGAEVALRFQQLTGPVMAKAVEDTVFYRYLPLSSRNEVGGDPGRLDDTLESFHAAAEAAHRERPLGLLATSTHDTKRSEDVRARISVLAEAPALWASVLERWWEAACEVALPPDRTTAWLILQTLAGAWPISPERAVAYVEKAAREAKEHTSWTDPDPVYERSVADFVRAVIADPRTARLVEELVQAILRPGRAVALAQKLLTLTAPGVPDLYQGSELWDLSLVDPDNRRPVDYPLRRHLLAEGVDARGAWSGEDRHGASKLAVVSAALRLRAERPEAFGPGPAGGYRPLRAEGDAAEHLVGFTRGGEVAVLATRWPLLLERAGGWRSTQVTLPAGEWDDRLGGGSWSGTVTLGALLDGLPVALLARRAGEGS
jgi:(1->4)-alpha-D-glucan 1-alpha-D-glucosylmutase